MKTYFIHYFQEHLRQLHQEISAYQNEADLWIVAPGISNSAGNLCCHLIGNLNHYIGAALGHTGYQRDRELEFSIKNVPQAQLLQAIEKLSGVVTETLQGIDDWEADYPENYFAPQQTIAYYMFRFLTHFNYHLGQINYHRRLLSEAL